MAKPATRWLTEREQMVRLVAAAREEVQHLVRLIDTAPDHENTRALEDQLKETRSCLRHLTRRG